VVSFPRLSRGMGFGWANPGRTFGGSGLLGSTGGLTLAGNFDCVSDSDGLAVVGVLPDALAESLVVAVL
jgi:hypothetical protein